MPCPRGVGCREGVNGYCPQILDMSLPRDGTGPLGASTKHSTMEYLWFNSCESGTVLDAWQRGEQNRHGAPSLGS